MIAAAAAACAVHAYAPAGRITPLRVLHGPGLLLDGGGHDVDRGWRWMHDTIVGSAQRGGNVVVLRAYGTNDYDAWAYRTAPFASVRTVLIPPCASRAQVNDAARYVRQADAVFFSGGDQANYAAWKGSALIQAVRDVYARGGVVGGTSAGLAIQGAAAYDSVAADRLLPDDQEVQSTDATRNPFEPAISFTRGLFFWPALRDTMTDTHFIRRHRFGRLIAFLARSGVRYGLGIDEASALAVDRNGIATLLETPEHGYSTTGAYVVRIDRLLQYTPGKPLKAIVRVTRISRPGARYDLMTHTGAGTTYTTLVDGSR